MSRTNENKLKMKDIATIGIFSALLFVVTMVAGALMGISMVLNMFIEKTVIRSFIASTCF